MVTSDLGRVTTHLAFAHTYLRKDCGDVRSRTSYNGPKSPLIIVHLIVVTSDLGRVTTLVLLMLWLWLYCGDVRSRTSYNHEVLASSERDLIVVTSDLGRVTTPLNCA